MESHSQIIRPLEGARGCLALAVAYHHLVFLYGHELIQYGLYAFLKPFCMGLYAVFGFFLLSGFVIMRAYQGKIFDSKVIRTFYLSRVRRLYGVYLLTLLLTWVFMDGWNQMSLVLKQLPVNLFMLQKMSQNLDQNWSWPFLGNTPLWSLGFEAFYYCMFPILMLVGSRLGYPWMAFGILTFSAFGWLYVRENWFIEEYWHVHYAQIIALGLFWWMGALMATDWFTVRFSRCHPGVAWFSLALIPTINRYFPEKYFFVVLAMVPLFMNLVLPPTNGVGRMTKWIEWIPFVLFGMSGYWAWAESIQMAGASKISYGIYFGMPIGIGVITLLIKKTRFLHAIGELLIRVGGISYAFYLIHWPVFLWGKRLYDNSHCSPQWFWGVALGSVCLALILSWLLESYFHRIYWYEWFSRTFHLQKKNRPQSSQWIVSRGFNGARIDEGGGT